ncbi:hypothetical protein AAON49_04800 [Pseudotenacibaculum sp. MALMAid0570]|uniref:hypothetical protein n=1 Tax=Pseudotenacibaculum sp. MALMAid0570 TaxID=3143938 RepID=UPI0032DF24A0
MKKEIFVYCIIEEIYSDYITKGKRYFIVDVKHDQVKIKNDNEYYVWIPSYCFSSIKPLSIVSIVVDDKIIDSKKDFVEVTFTFDDESKRWVTFMTILHLKSLYNEYRNYFTSSKVIFVEELIEEEIYQIINDLHRNNELIEISNAL